MLFLSLLGENVSTAQHQRLELKIKELETKLELEHTTRGRMETQINRLKEAIEKLNHECDSLRVKVTQHNSNKVQIRYIKCPHLVIKSYNVN